MKKLIGNIPVILLITVFLSGDFYYCANVKAYENRGNSFILPAQEEIAKLPPDGGDRYNRLIFEKSPYLLQHATNPVNWYPWGEEAFSKAVKEDKPIFLSIGYSTCHWCHVMEEESFSDPEVAALLNKYFIAIKVDREERPNIDKVFMNITQAVTGGGGWPMTIIMTPQMKTFFAGTYFPKTAQFGKAGLLQILAGVADIWNNDKKRITGLADEWDNTISGFTFDSPGEFPGKEILDETYFKLSSNFDSKKGGFTFQPVKFPLPNNLIFLIRYSESRKNGNALEMAEKTLFEMRLGGIYDHIGFGFHRYSTDYDWLVPHYEKMLYDQALIAMAYTEAYEATGKKIYARIAGEIFDYVSRNMTSPEGAFYSAEDADSEGEEGKFYLWTKDEIIKILGKRDGEFFSRIFNIKEKGNYRDEIRGKETGKNIIFLNKPLSVSAGELKADEGKFFERIEKMRRKLFNAREKRIKPFRDDKILTDWNGLMIASLAKASVAFDEKRYAESAGRSVQFILSRLRRNDGRLLKRYWEDNGAMTAHLEDYAFFVRGLIELYEATFEVKYLKEAINLSDIMLADFWDKKNGGFFFSPRNGEKLPFRTKEIYDGVTPSGNSVAVMNLLKLSRITGNQKYEEKAKETIRAFAKIIKSAPYTHAYLMSAIDYAINPGFEIIITGNIESDDTKKMLSAVRKKYIPKKVILLRPQNAQSKNISKIAPFSSNMKAISGKATAYVCKNFACSLPTTNIEKMLELLSDN